MLRLKNHPPTVKLYEKRLVEEGDIQQEDIDFIKNGSMHGLEDSFQRAKEQDVKIRVDTMQGVWSKFSKMSLDSEPATKLLKEQMHGIVQALTGVPRDFTPNSKLVKLLQSRKEMAEGKIPVDWGFAEALSFGSILESGFRIRLSGQDSQRGTFSHRHAVLVDTNTNEKYIPLNHISPKQAKAEIINSSLSEFSVLGFVIRIFSFGSERTRDMGSSVRRLCKQRSGDFRPIHFQLGSKVAATFRTYNASSSRVRRSGTGTFLR